MSIEAKVPDVSCNELKQARDTFHPDTKYSDLKDEERKKIFPPLQRYGVVLQEGMSYAIAEARFLANLQLDNDSLLSDIAKKHCV